MEFRGVLFRSESIKDAEGVLKVELNDHFSIVLTDHISFAIERQREGIELRNKLMYEIKILYKEEYEIGLWAIEHIKRKLNVEMPKDEAARSEERRVGKK